MPDYVERNECIKTHADISRHLASLDAKVDAIHECVERIEQRVSAQNGDMREMRETIASWRGGRIALVWMIGIVMTVAGLVIAGLRVLRG